MIYYQLLYSYQPQVKPEPGEEDRRSWWKWTFTTAEERRNHMGIFNATGALHEIYMVDVVMGVEGLDEVMSYPPFSEVPRNRNPTSRVHKGAPPEAAVRVHVSAYQAKLDSVPAKERKKLIGEGRWTFYE